MPIKMLKPSRGHKRGKTSGWGSRHSDHERMGRTPNRKFGGATRHNTRRENRLEELGRVDAEKAYTSRGKRNLSEEKNRIRSELKTGGRASPKFPDTVRNPSRPKKAGPSAPFGSKSTKPKAGPSIGGRKKYGSRFPSKEAMRSGGGPDAGRPGKLKDMLSKFKDKGLGKKAGPSLEDLQRIRDKMPKKYPPKREMQPLRKGGSAKGPNRPRPTGPHMWVRGDKRKKYAAGKVIKGAVSGVKKILSGLGKEIKKQPLPKKTKDLNKKFKKAFPHHDSKGKLKTTRPGYSSGGVVMAGKKVGCQIK